MPHDQTTSPSASLAIALGLQAAARRLPFAVTRAGLGSDVMRTNPWLKTVRPNSPPQMTTVSSSMPRCFRSRISAALARSV